MLGLWRANGWPRYGMAVQMRRAASFVVFVTLMSKRQSAGPEGTILAVVNLLR